MKFLNKINLTLFAIAMLTLSTQAFGMKTMKKFFGFGKRTSQIEGAQEGIADDGPPADFNFEKASKQIHSLNKDVVIINKETFLVLCEQTALGEASVKDVYNDIHFVLRIPISPNITTTDDRKKTPLHFLAQKDEALPIIKMLLKWGALVNAQDATQATPLHYAIQSKSKEVAETLINNKADVFVTDSHGKTPLDYAAENPELLALLGANKEGAPSAFAEKAEHKDDDNKEDN